MISIYSTFENAFAFIITLHRRMKIEDRSLVINAI